jgi:hypothetical protein
MEITVGTEDLRLALRSVAPHADPDAGFPQLHRVRLEIGTENLTVSATNRYTIGHALVSIWDNADGEIGAFDLSPTDIKEILVLFRGKAGDGDEPDNTLVLKADDEHLTVTDVSGLFPGKQLQLPRYPMEDNYPDIAKVISEKLAKGPESTERLLTSGSMLGLFMKAAAAYGEPLVIDPAGDAGAMLISCGESFVGLLMPLRADDDTVAEINGWHFDWLKRIADRVVTS